MKTVVLTLVLALHAFPGHAADVQTELAHCVTGSPSQLWAPEQKNINTTVDHVRWQIRAHKLDEALALAQQWTTSNPGSADLQAVLGEVYYQMGKMSLAIPAFNRALELDACNAHAHYYSWRLNALAGKAAEARQQLFFAHQLLPQDPQILRSWEAVQRAIEMESALGAPQVTSLKPLRDHFFAKTLDCSGIPIRSAAIVDSDALVLACGKVRVMLQNLPAARRSLITAGAEFHIIGEFQGTSDLPENAAYRSSTYVDAEGHGTDMNARTRGVGGLKSSCGEENLLGLPGDRYGDGSDTCTHEFAHDLMDHGLNGQQHAAIEKQYHNAISRGLWKGSYAAVNAQEYWAELSMWYFGSHGNRVSTALMLAGPDALRMYDPAGFALLESIYGGHT
ncbi:MAG TPA: hypothetical protein VGB94_12450 [Acidobacteriaceae bacterium]